MTSIRKVCVVVHSRANYGRVKSLLDAIKADASLEMKLILGTSANLPRFGELAKIIESDGFVVDEKIYNSIEGDNLSCMAKSTGLGIMELASSFDRDRPDVVVTIADRYETMSTAIAASYMNIPLAHIQGGEVTGSIDESVRHAITKLSNIHFPATERAASFIERMGEQKSSIYCVGCPSLDLLKSYDLGFEYIGDLGGVGCSLDLSKGYVLVLQHAVTTEFGNGSTQIIETLLAVEKLLKDGRQVLWLWPNIDPGSESISKEVRRYRELNDLVGIRFVKNLDPITYARVLNHCDVIIGNSSSGIREASFLGVPSVNVGTRQIGRERSSNVIDVEYCREQIFEAAKFQIGHGRYSPSNLFGYGDAGKQIASKLVSMPLTPNKTINYLTQ